MEGTAFATASIRVLGAANGTFRALKTQDMADDGIVRKLEKRAF